MLEEAENFIQESPKLTKTTSYAVFSKRSFQLTFQNILFYGHNIALHKTKKKI